MKNPWCSSSYVRLYYNNFDFASLSLPSNNITIWPLNLVADLRNRLKNYDQDRNTMHPLDWRYCSVWSVNKKGKFSTERKNEFLIFYWKLNIFFIGNKKTLNYFNRMLVVYCSILSSFHNRTIFLSQMIQTVNFAVGGVDEFPKTEKKDANW